MAYFAFRLLTLSVLFVYGHASPLPNPNPNPNPRADLGGPAQIRFEGTAANNVESFLNIRFGQDTSGANRFASPKPFTYAPDTVVNATQAGAACPQPYQAVPNMPLFDNVTHMSEDCLTLRIDRPANTPASAKLPVMVWIYGGGDSFGQIYDSAYNPTALVAGAAKKGFPIIYAAMNYRVGIFGFAASSALNASDSLNAGLLDQRLALEWVRDHIEAFGGDPDNVTIFGESDGATGVGLQITAYGGREQVPFKRAIMQSGSPMADPGTASNQSAAHTSQLTKIVNCTSLTSSAELQCLRNLPMEKLNSAAVLYEAQVGGEYGMDVFIPISPSTFIPDSPSRLLSTGRFARNIDILAGWNEDDGTISTPTNLASDKDVAQFLKAEYPLLATKDIEHALALYPLSSFSSSFPASLLAAENITAQFFRTSRMQRDLEYSCPSLYLSQMTNRYSTTSHTANYLFALNQTIFRSIYAAVNVSYLGVSHFSDIPYVFNEAQSPGYAPFASAEDRVLSSEMSGSWAAFAAFGRPSVGVGAGNGTIAGWVGASEGDYRLQVIGGPHNGTRTIGRDDGTGSRDGNDYDDLAARCAFWTSEDVVAKLQV